MIFSCLFFGFVVGVGSIVVGVEWCSGWCKVLGCLIVFFWLDIVGLECVLFCYFYYSMDGCF